MNRFFLLSMLLFVCCLDCKADQFLSVNIKEAKLRSRPQHWSTAVATLRYGDRVLKLSENAGWLEVSVADKKTGYIQSSAVSSQKIVFASTELARTMADPGEAVLAGKGFSKATEERFAKDHASANFAAVNKLEQVKLSDSEMQAFVSAGKLK